MNRILNLPLKTQAALVFITALLIIGLQLFLVEKETPYADHISYMAVALPLHDTGIYEDGNFKGSILPPGPNNEGMFFAPGYPAFLSAIMALDSGLRETARCSIELVKPHLIEEQCALNFNLLWSVHLVLGALSSVLIWLSALALFNRPALAWASALLVITLGSFAYYASIVMAENIVLPLFYASCYGLILSWQKQKWFYAVLTGFAAGLLILTKPSFIYAFYFLIITIGGLGLYHLFKHKSIKTLRLVLLSALSAALVVSPWIYRNHVKLDHAAITFGYGAFTLAQRVAYNDMSIEEWLVSWVYGIPGEGDSIAEKLFEKELYERWEWGHSDGFYQQGNGDLRAETLEAAGSHEEHFSYLLKHYVVADLPWHIATTFPLIFRGMWVFELWLFIPYLAFAFLCVHCIKTRKYDYLLYMLPPWFMLGLHGFASVNIPRYNVILQACLGMALAWAILKLWDKRQTKKKAAP